MILWVLFCKMNEEMDMLYGFDAKDRDDAQRQAKSWKNKGYKRIEKRQHEYKRGSKIKGADWAMLIPFSSAISLILSRIMQQ